MDSSLLKDPLLGSEDVSSAHFFIHVLCGPAFEIVYSNNHSSSSHHTNISQWENKLGTGWLLFPTSEASLILILIFRCFNDDRLWQNGYLYYKKSERFGGTQIQCHRSDFTGHSCCFLNEGNGKRCFYQGKSVMMFTLTSRLKWGLKLE